MSNLYPRGSEWRKWDLHVHTPGTKLNDGYVVATNEDIWEKFCEKIEGSDIEVIGITDYFSIDNFFIFKEKFQTKYPASKKVFFPNIEFRLDVSVNKNVQEVNLHLIFDKEVKKEKIQSFLSKLETNKTRNGAIVYCSDLQNDEFKSACVSYKNILEVLREVFGKNDCYLIITATNDAGIRADTRSPRKMSISDEIDKISHGFFGSRQNFEYYLQEDRYEDKEKAERKPVIAGSDCHSFDDIEQYLGKIFLREVNNEQQVHKDITWIKADLTFEGLKEILYEPSERVFIGEEPKIFEKVDSNKTKYIKSLKINQKNGYEEEKGIWFKDVNISFNKELVAIIGNKGSGKSAISDILGLLGNTHISGVNNENFSFLNNLPKKKKFRQKGFAENFAAKLEWVDNSVVEKNLADDIDLTEKERVRYLPQSYFETLTNDLEGQGFEKTLKNVIFLHIPEAKRYSKETFEELDYYKSQSIEKDILLLKDTLKDISSEVIALEKRKHPSYKKEIENKLQIKLKELEEHKKIKPQQKKDPSKNKKLDKEKEKIFKEIKIINKQLIDIDKQIKDKDAEKIKLTAEKEDIQQLNDDLLRFDNQINNFLNENKKRLQEHGIEITKLLTFKFEKDILKKKILALNSSINKLDESLKTEEEIEFEFFADEDKIKKAKENSLIVQKQVLKNKILKNNEKLSDPERKYQEYREKLGVWENRLKNIQGDPNDPRKILDTVEFYRSELTFIIKHLNKELNKKRKERLNESLKIFNKKKEMLDLYKEFKDAIDKRINYDKSSLEKFRINIDVSFKLDTDFNSRFLEFIDKRQSGTFYNRSDGEKFLSKLFEDRDLIKAEDISQILENIIIYLETDQREGMNLQRNIIDQINRIEDFYDLIFSLEYLKPNYELKLESKTLNELSPGEKGALLLVFYLMIDKEDIPLIIDQPEDNLDNQSVFNVLTHFIRSAKKKRQIIVVTHNPNLAVGADAEQIIYVNLDKQKKYKFIYETGSIENPLINKRIVDILEGTRPAFDKRKLKYFTG